MDIVQIAEIVGGFLFFVFLILPLIIGAINSPKPKELTCPHGATRDCKLCRDEAEQSFRREGYKQEWEKLRRAEIKRLSQARLQSSQAYFAMEPREFEDAIMKVFRKLGYKVNQTVYVGDGGKDAIAWMDRKKYVIECKRYGSRSAVGRRDLQILLAAKHDVEADGAIFVSTGRFTAPAVAYAKENGIQYYDKDTFPDLINRAYGGGEGFCQSQNDLPRMWAADLRVDWHGGRRGCEGGRRRNRIGVEDVQGPRWRGMHDPPGSSSNWHVTAKVPRPGPRRPMVQRSQCTHAQS